MQRPVPPPRLPTPPAAYQESYMTRLLNQLRLYFELLDRKAGSVSRINLDTLPTDADLASLPAGAVYRDTTADNTLKVKV